MSISANELRRGNLISLFDIGRPEAITVISEKVIQIKSDLICGETYKIKDIKPIPLSPEILDKCGFDKKECQSYASGDEITFFAYSKSGFTYNSIQDKWWYSGSILEKQPVYLHQLQNLYFALTGEELTINL